MLEGDDHEHIFVAYYPLLTCYIIIIEAMIRSISAKAFLNLKVASQPIFAINSSGTRNIMCSGGERGNNNGLIYKISWKISNQQKLLKIY